MGEKRQTELDFMRLAGNAAQCAEGWKQWAEQHKADTYAHNRAVELAALFEQQARILHHMHHNRVTWQRPTRDDYAGRKP